MYSVSEKRPSKNFTHDSISLKSHTISKGKVHFKCAEFVHITLQSLEVRIYLPFIYPNNLKMQDSAGIRNVFRQGID